MSTFLLSVTDMETCEEGHVDDVNIAQEAVLGEDSGNVICDENLAAAAVAAATVEHLEEDDEEDFEDALDNLTLDPVSIADERDIISKCYSASTEHEVDTLQASCNKLHDVSDIVLPDEIEASAGVATSVSNERSCDSRHSSLCEDEEVASEMQESATDIVIVDEEVLREREACLTDEEKQVKYTDVVNQSN